MTACYWMYSACIGDVSLFFQAKELKNAWGAGDNGNVNQMHSIPSVM